MTLRLLVPAYANPCCGGGPDMWSALLQTAERIRDDALDAQLVVIFNPASGPGTTVDPNYVNANNNAPLQLLSAAGATILGYVASTYGARPIADVKADIDKYYGGLYDAQLMGGIFIDEMSGNLDHVAYHNSIETYIKGVSASALSIGNPGSGYTQPNANNAPYTVDDHYTAFDMLVSFEGAHGVYSDGAAFPAYAPAAIQQYTADRLCHIVHSVDAAQWQAALTLATDTRGVNCLFLTDDTMPNPFDVLPSFWADMVDVLLLNATGAASVQSGEAQQRRGSKKSPKKEAREGGTKGRSPKGEKRNGGDCQ